MARAEITAVFALPAGSGVGGLSGLELSADGARFLALSDSAALVRGAIGRDAAGQITAIVPDGAAQPLPDGSGVALADPFDDSEGLAEAPDGSLFISFELHHRVERFDANGAYPVPLPQPREFLGLGENSGLEALAIAPDGALYTLPEGPASGASQFPVFRYRDNKWDRPFTLAGEGTWRPVGADFGPDGRLYLLERDFWALVGFQSRLRRISFDQSGVTADEILLTTTAGAFGNLEGLSVWTDGQGRLHLTMVADNNFLPLVATQFVEAVLLDGLDQTGGAD